MAMRRAAGASVDTEVWQTDEPTLDALLTPADNVVVLEVVEEVSPGTTAVSASPPPPTRLMRGDPPFPELTTLSR